METAGKILGCVLLLGIGGWIIFGSHSSSSSSGSVGRYGEYEDAGYDDYENLEDLAYDHWDEVREYMSGSETIEACSDSGCYDLDAEISDGSIEMVYFPNGGYIYPDAEIDEGGSADGYDSDGNYWEFEVDTGSDTVQDAITDWASDYRSDYEEYEDYDYRY